MSSVTGAVSGPASLPSYAVYLSAGPASTTRSNASAIPNRPLMPSSPRTRPPSTRPRPRPLPTSDALRVEIKQPTVGVVFLLQQLVGRTVVGRPELVLLVVRGGVQRLASPEVGHQPLDQPVVVAVLLSGRQLDARPEP